MKLRYVDVLRGLAILGVIVIHCSQHGDNSLLPQKMLNIINKSTMGVQLFYIASAFTLFLSMSRRIKEERFPRLNFFLRRFFRIAPMYYVGIFYYLWQSNFGHTGATGDVTGITSGTIASNFLFIHGFSPYWINSLVPGGWSIAVEMSFYCLVPFLFNWIKNMKQAFWTVLGSLALAYLFHHLIVHFLPSGSSDRWDGFLYFFLPNQLPIFSLGILFYFIIKENYKLSVDPWFIILLSVIVISQMMDVVQLIPAHFVYGIAFVLLATALSRYDFKILVNPVFIYLGKISYSMYLVHFAVLQWLDKLNISNFINVTGTFTSVLNYTIRYFVVLLMTTIIASVFYYIVEIPFQKLGKKLIERINLYQPSPVLIRTNAFLHTFLALHHNAKQSGTHE